MYNHNKAQQSKNRVYISWDILYLSCRHVNRPISQCISPISRNDNRNMHLWGMGLMHCRICEMDLFVQTVREKLLFRASAVFPAQLERIDISGRHVLL